MSRLRRVLLSLFAVVAVSAGASASALAAEWYVNGTLLANTILLKVTGLGALQRLGITVGGIKLEIHCTAVHVKFSIHNGLGTNNELMGLGFGHLLYLGCRVFAPKPKTVEGCKASSGSLPAEEIETEELKSLAITKSSEPWVEFKPVTGTTFVGILFSGCTNTGLNGTNTVTGTANAKANNTTFELEAKTGAGELEFAGATASYVGSGQALMEGTTEGIEVK